MLVHVETVVLFEASAAVWRLWPVDQQTSSLNVVAPVGVIWSTHDPSVDRHDATAAKKGWAHVPATLLPSQKPPEDVVDAASVVAVTAWVAVTAFEELVAEVVVEAAVVAPPPCPPAVVTVLPQALATEHETTAITEANDRG